MSKQTEIRLNRFLAERLGVSRREADDLIVKKRVLVDGQSAVLGCKVDKNSKVCYNGEMLPFEAIFSYVMLNKPVGYIKT